MRNLDKLADITSRVWRFILLMVVLPYKNKDRPRFQYTK